MALNKAVNLSIRLCVSMRFNFSFDSCDFGILQGGKTVSYEPHKVRVNVSNGEEELFEFNRWRKGVNDLFNR